MFAEIATTMETIGTTAGNLSQALTGTGTSLVFALLGMILAWHVFMMILDGSPQETLAKGWNSVIMAAIAYALIANWSLVLGTPASPGFFDSVTDIIVESTGAGNGAFDATIMSLGDAITKLMSTDYVSAQRAARGDTDWLDVSKISANVGNVVGDYAGGLAATLASFLVAGLIGLAAMVFVILINIGTLLMYVMAFLGPIFVPFIIFPPASFLFDGWFRMMITASLYKVVGWAIAFISMGIIESITGAVTVATTADTPDGKVVSAFVPMLVAGFWAFLVLYLMTKIPEIAQGIAGGQSIGPRFRMPRTRGKEDKPEKIKKDDDKPKAKAPIPAPGAPKISFPALGFTSGAGGGASPFPSSAQPTLARPSINGGSGSASGSSVPSRPLFPGSPGSGGPGGATGSGSGASSGNPGSAKGFGSSGGATGSGAGKTGGASSASSNGASSASGSGSHANAGGTSGSGASGTRAGASPSAGSGRTASAAQSGTSSRSSRSGKAAVAAAPDGFPSSANNNASEFMAPIDGKPSGWYPSKDTLAHNLKSDDGLSWGITDHNVTFKDKNGGEGKFDKGGVGGLYTRKSGDNNETFRTKNGGKSWDRINDVAPSVTPKAEDFGVSSKEHAPSGWYPSKADMVKYKADGSVGGHGQGVSVRFKDKTGGVGYLSSDGLTGYYINSKKEAFYTKSGGDKWSQTDKVKHMAHLRMANNLLRDF